MPIITIASTKGGVGKSTLAVNLATQLLKQGIKVALLDGDPQGSVTKWNVVREAMIEQGEKLGSLFVASAQGESLLNLAVTQSENSFFVIIDSAGVDTASTRNALLKTDYVLTLSAPSPLDLWEVDPLLKVVNNLERIQKRRLPVLLAFNKVKAKTVTEALDFLQETQIFPSYIFKTVLRDRMVFQHCIKEGKGVNEYSPANTEARNELESLTQELLTFVQAEPVKL